MRDGLVLVQQTDFEGTKLPRWGCYWMSMGAWGQLRYDYLMSHDHIESLYYRQLEQACRIWDVREEAFRHGTVLEVRDGILNCMRPDLAFQGWLDTLARGLRGFHTGKHPAPGWFMGAPQRETFRLRRYTTPNGNGHYVLTDLKDRLQYNPDLAIPTNRASHVYETFYVEGEDEVC